MDKSDLRSLSKVRISEAKALLTSEHYNGAYYLAGYSVECAIKAYIAGQIKSNVVPDKNFEKGFYQHNLESLMRFAGLWPKFEADMKVTPSLALNWTIVKDWSEVARYNSTISQAKANDLYNAIIARRVGVLRWVNRCI